MLEFLKSMKCIRSKELDFTINLESFFTLCEMYDYNKSMRYVCNDIINSIKGYCIYSDTMSIDNRVNILSNMAKI